MKEVLAFLREYRLPVYREETGQGIYRHVYLREAPSSGKVLVCLVAVKAAASAELRNWLAGWRKNFLRLQAFVSMSTRIGTNVILGKRYERISGNMELEDTFLGVRLGISPAAFYQVNTAQAQRLYQLAFDFAEFQGSEHLLDLYCGIGSIGLSAYGRIGRLTGVEIVPEAVENARANAPQKRYGKRGIFLRRMLPVRQNVWQLRECGRM